MRKLPAYVFAIVLLAACAQRSNLDAIGERVEEFGKDRIATPIMQAARMKEALPLLDEVAGGSSRAGALASEIRSFVKDTLEKAPDWGVASLRTLEIGEKVAALEGLEAASPASWLNTRFEPFFDLSAARERCARLRVEIPAMDVPALDAVDAVSANLGALREHAFAECREIILTTIAAGGLISEGSVAWLRELKRTVDAAVAEVDALRMAFGDKLAAVRNSALTPASAAVTFTRGMNILFFDVAPKEALSTIAELPAEAYCMASGSITLPVSSVTGQGGRLRLVVSGENLPGSYFRSEGIDASLSLEYGDSANEGCSVRLCPATVSSTVGAVVEEISPVSASVRAILPEGPVDEWGVCFSKGTVLCNEYVKGPDGGNHLLIQSLEPGAHYWFKVYAIVSGEVVYSDVGDFSTLSLESTVRIASVGEITFCTAVVSGNTDATLSAVPECRCGLCYVAGDAVPTVDDKVAEVAAGAGGWTVSLSALVPETLYTCRSFVQAAGHVAYGEQLTFTTAPCPDLVFTDAAADVSYLEATLNGRLYNVPAAVASKTLGFVYGTSAALEGAAVKYVTDVDADGSFSIGIGSLEHSTDYWFKAIAVLDGVRYEGSAVRFHTTDVILTSGDSVDLGLSVDWASRNLGAKEPCEQGFLYAWGETGTKAYYFWDNYIWGQKDSFAKYSAASDGKTVLDPGDDAATVILGQGWRMPDAEECQELKDNTTWYFIELNGYWGDLIVSEKNGECIFLSGNHDLTHDFVGTKFWTSVRSSDSSAYCIAAEGKGLYSKDRCAGLPVRPVREK